MYTFDADMHVTWSNGDNPSIFPVTVVADHAATVIEKGPAIILEQYDGEASKIEFFSVTQRQRIELVIP